MIRGPGFGFYKITIFKAAVLGALTLLFGSNLFNRITLLNY